MVNFVGKLCLAPMVRSGELPTRLMALKYGADLVWTPEMVDKKIIQTTRVVNDKINTIDYILNEPNNKKQKTRLVFRTLPKLESSKLVFQLGSSDPKLAVEAALKVIGDVDGIDLNCGCPKPFSTHSGMGAALLSTPELLCSILTNLVEKVGKPNKKSISCKIRLLKSFEETKTLVNDICNTGISNLTIHCRTKDMRNRDDPIWTYLPKLIPFIQSKGVSVIINGNLQCRQDFENLQSVLNNREIGGMIAECAESNPSVFSHKPLKAKDSIAEFLEYCDIYNYDNLPNSKYVVLTHIPGKSKFYQKMGQQKSHEDLIKVAQEILQSDDILMDKILAKDLQKQRHFTEEEYQEFIDSKKTELENSVKQANETNSTTDENEVSLKRVCEEDHITTKKIKINIEDNVEKQTVIGV